VSLGSISSLCFLEGLSIVWNPWCCGSHIPRTLSSFHQTSNRFGLFICLALKFKIFRVIVLPSRIAKEHHSLYLHWVFTVLKMLWIQVAAQPAMECLPLVMEPESRFYTSPVVVLDFQSLYPSMIIAYNLCFSTCLGKIVPNNPKVLGVTNLALRPGLLKELKEQLTITPNGVLYTPPEVHNCSHSQLLSFDWRGVFATLSP
jgi:hypothetical protein